MKRKLIQQATTLKAIDVSELSGSTAKVGVVLDFLGYNDAILTVNNAITTSDPSVATLTLTMVEGDTSSPATAVTFASVPAAIDCKTAAGVTNYHIDLRGFKRYGKFTLTPAFTGGTSPKIPACASIVLGSANVEPVPSAVTVYAKA